MRKYTVIVVYERRISFIYPEPIFCGSKLLSPVVASSAHEKIISAAKQDVRSISVILIAFEKLYIDCNN